jgi:hypothetical protein
MIPVSDAGQDDSLEVSEDRVERLPLLGRIYRERAPYVARLRAREHGVPLGRREVVRNPVGDPMRFAPERLRIHVAHADHYFF